MKETESRHIQLKTVIALRELFNDNVSQKEKNKLEGKKDLFLNATKGKVADSTGLRRATISDVLNCKSIPNIVTVGLILYGLGKGFNDFAKVYNKISMEEMQEFEKQLKGK